MWFLVLKPFILPILLAGTLISGGFYLKAKYDDYQTLKENNAELEIAIEEQKAVLIAKENDFKQIKESFHRQQEQNAALLDDISKLQTKFNKVKADGSKRDLGNLLLNKTNLVEKIINKGTRKVFRCFEVISKNENNVNCDNIINP